MQTLLEVWIGIILVFICGMIFGANIRTQQYEKKRKAPSISSPEFFEVNCRHKSCPIIETCGRINPCEEETRSLHKEELRKRRKAFNSRMHNVPEGGTKKTVYIEYRDGKPVAMKEIYNDKGV